jgi:hypothetical protein
MFFFLFFLCTLFNTALPASLRFHCVEKCWDQTQDCCDFDIYNKMHLTTRLDLIHKHPTCTSEIFCVQSKNGKLKVHKNRFRSWFLNATKLYKKKYFNKYLFEESAKNRRCKLEICNNKINRLKNAHEDICMSYIKLYNALAIVTNVV